MLNVAAIVGRLSAEPELSHTASGVAVTSFTLAVDRSYAKAGTERQTDWIDVVAWRSTAEFICKYFTKGQMMAVTGSIQTRSYEDRSGNKRKAVEIQANDVSLSLIHILPIRKGSTSAKLSRKLAFTSAAYASGSRTLLSWAEVPISGSMSRYSSAGCPTASTAGSPTASRPQSGTSISRSIPRNTRP